MIQLLYSILIAVICFCFTLLAQAKEVAITFDDAPRDGTILFNGEQRAQKLIAGLKEAQVPEVVFFANTARFNEEGRKRMKMYTAAGHFVANHTHDHPDFNNTSLQDYLISIQSAHDVLKVFPNFKRLFRFPFLREGDSREKRDRARAFLRSLNYGNAYITINNYDWYMDRLLQDALKQGKKVNYNKLRTVYLEVLLACVTFYDEMAKKFLGRSPRHVFLLHENDLNALFIVDLVKELRQKAWQIITPEDAYKDQIAAYQTEAVLSYNPGRIGEIARDHGYRANLWHESCNENYLENLFSNRHVFQ